MATQPSPIWKGENNLQANHRSFTAGSHGSSVPLLKTPAPLATSGTHLGREILPGQPLNKHGHHSLCTSAQPRCSPCWGLWCGSATSPQRLRIILHKVFILYIVFFLKIKKFIQDLKTQEWVRSGDGLVPPGWAGRDRLVRGCQTLCAPRHSSEISLSPNSSSVSAQGLS